MSTFPVLIEAALTYVRLNMAHRSRTSRVRGPWPPVTFFKVRPYLLFYDRLPLCRSLVCAFARWMSDQAQWSVWRTCHGSDPKPTSVLLQSYLYPRRPPSRGDNSPGGCALASGHTITPMASFHVSRSLRSFLADGGDKAAARSRLGRPAQRVYLCSAVPPHCCA